MKRVNSLQFLVLSLEEESREQRAGRGTKAGRVVNATKLLHEMCWASRRNTSPEGTMQGGGLCKLNRGESQTRRAIRHKGR
jgi:hypothetical protein